MRSCVVFALALAFIARSAPAQSTDPHAKIRPQTPRIQQWLATALETSPTVRALVARIEHSDMIVYLDIRHDLGADTAAYLTWMAATARARIVRASLRPDLRGVDAVAMIAHELRHVVELVEHPEVRSHAGLLELYARIGHATTHTGKRWDTQAAIAAGTEARLEATGNRRPTATAASSLPSARLSARVPEPSAGSPRNTREGASRSRPAASE